MIEKNEAPVQSLSDRGRARTLKGVVVSSCRQKTITVEVQQLKRHYKYGRFIRTRARYHAHDEDNTCVIGDEVIIAESRPRSRLKRWRLRQIIKKQQQEQ